MVRIVNGTKGLWDEWSMVRMVYTWYEKSVVRIVNSTNSPVTNKSNRYRQITWSVAAGWPVRLIVSTVPGFFFRNRQRQLRVSWINSRACDLFCNSLSRIRVAGACYINVEADRASPLTAWVPNYKVTIHPVSCSCGI